MSALADFCKWCRGPDKAAYERHILYTIEMIKDPSLITRRGWRDLNDAIHNYLVVRLLGTWNFRFNQTLSENELITAKRLFKDYATKLAAK